MTNQEYDEMMDKLWKEDPDAWYEENMRNEIADLYRRIEEDPMAYFEYHNLNTPKHDWRTPYTEPELRQWIRAEDAKWAMGRRPKHYYVWTEKEGWSFKPLEVTTATEDAIAAG